MKKIERGVYRVRQRIMIAWSHAGKQYRELLPLGTTERAAIQARNRKVVEAEDGKAPAVARQVRYEELMERRRVALENDRKVVKAVPRLDDHFRGWRATRITYAALQDYVRWRQEEGAAASTIHNELAALRRAFRLARKAGLVTVVPDFPMPRVENVREAYFTVAELARLVAALPEHLRAPVEFAAATGWRAGNVFDLEWEHVDFGTGTVRCPIGTTKTGEPLSFPFAVGSPLARLLRAREREARGPYVFHRRGEKIRSYAAAWQTAVRSLGAAGYGRQYDPVTGGTRKVLKRFHDLRHTFAQRATDAEVPEATLLALGGWKTPAMLARYRIVDQRAKRAAAAKLDAHLAAERAAAEREAKKVVDLKLVAAAGGR
jgi:integrase